MLPQVPLEQLNALGDNTMIAHLGIRITELGEDYICGTMPVDHRTHQPMGLLHGGANAVLAETLGSFGSSLLVDLATHSVSGLEINCNHIRATREGTVTGKATLRHKGRTTHIWEVEITNPAQKLVSLARLTVIVIPHQ